MALHHPIPPGSCFSPPHSFYTVCVNCCGLLQPHAERNIWTCYRCFLNLPHPDLVYLLSHNLFLPCFFWKIKTPLQVKPHSEKWRNKIQTVLSKRKANCQSKTPIQLCKAYFRTRTHTHTKRLEFEGKHAKRTLVNLRKFCTTNRKQYRIVILSLRPGVYTVMHKKQFHKR